MRDRIDEEMRDRIVELIEPYSCCYTSCLKSIADQLLANGFILPPCKVGDKLYALSASNTKLYLLTITHFVVCENETQIWAVGVPYTYEPAYICNADDLGDNEWVYLTREEAEKALNERREG